MTGSATTTRTYAVTLTIPDNEAFTAFETLARLGLPVARVVRADIWQFDIGEGAGDLTAMIAANETIHNPNKHRLVEREGNGPIAGEVWIAPRDETRTSSVAGRPIPGVRSIRRRTAWRLLGDDGADVDSGVLDRAVETFLCNPAFEVAIR